MVKTNQIDLTKSKFNLDKTTNNINFVKNSDSLELVKKSPLLDQLNLLKKAPKLPGGFPDINFTEPVDNLTKIPIQPFELYWTDQTAEPDFPDGLPFSFSPIGLEPEIVLDSCHIGIGVQPVLGFIKLPQQQIVYKYAECDPNKPPNPPPPATPNSVYLPPAPPGCWYNTFWSRTVEGSYRISFFGPDEENDFVKNTVSYGTGDYSLPDPLKHVVEIQTSNVTEPYYYEGEAKAKGFRDAGLSYRQPSIVDTFTYAKVGQDPNVESFASYAEGHVIYQGNYTGSFHKETYTANGSTWTITTGSGKTTELLAARTYGGEITAVIPIQSRENYITITPYGYATSYLVCGSMPYDYTQNNPPPPPPLVLPPPSKTPPPDEMNCCPQILALLQLLIIRVNQLDGRLQLLDQEVKETNKCLGVEEFPAVLPKRLIYPNAKGEEKIENIVQALGYQVKQIDKAVGYLPQKIKVLDTNSAMAGNQSVEVEIHSFADFAKETLQYLIDTEGDDDTLTNIAVRILYECGAIHQLSVQIAAMVDAAIEHLDFKEGWKTVEVPFAYDPYAGQKGKKAGEGFGATTSQPLPLTEEELEKLMPDLLKETLVKIKILINTQKRTLNDLLQELLRDTRLAAAGVSENASSKRLVELVDAAQAALQLQNTIARNNVRKALTSGDLRTRKKPK